MIWISLSIVTSTALLIIFRWVKSNGGNTRHVIMTNYAVACLSAALWFRPALHDFSWTWLIPSILLGMFFYGVFRSTAHTAQISGVAVAGIATKMSVVIPVVLALFLLNETVSVAKIFGILLGLGAVALASSGQLDLRSLKWPLFAFFGSGIIDACLKFFQVWFAPDFDFPAFIVTVFGCAFLTSFTHHITLPDKKVERISLLSGILLGTANFVSLIAILNALALPHIESSVIFPINNFGVVAFSALTALVLFKEPIGWRNSGSIALASISIILLFFLA